MLSACFILVKSVNHKTYVELQQDIVYEYSDQYHMNKKINLQKNTYMSEDEILSSQTYLSDLISTIDLDFKYKYVASHVTSIVYDYTIELKIVSNLTVDKDEYNVLNKKEVLKSSQGTVNANQFRVEEKVKIDYKKYNDLINSFKSELGIRPISEMQIVLTVIAKTGIDEKNIVDKYTQSYNISLGEKVAKINGVSDDIRNNNVTKNIEITHEKEKDEVAQLISLILMTVDTLLVIYLLTQTTSIKTINNEFKLNVNKILRYYDEKIVQISSLKGLDFSQAILVVSFDELMNLAEEEGKSMLCYVDETRETAYFIVVKYNKNYVYVMR